MFERFAQLVINTFICSIDLVEVHWHVHSLNVMRACSWKNIDFILNSQVIVKKIDIDMAKE